MSLDVKQDSLPGQAHVRALQNARGELGVSFLYRGASHQECQVIRSRIADAAVGPVFTPWLAFKLGAQLCMAAFVCLCRRCIGVVKGA